MAERRITTTEAMSPDGKPSIGRGYDLGFSHAALRPSSDADAADTDELRTIGVSPERPDEREALRLRAFGLDREVRLVEEDGALAVYDAGGSRRVGRVSDREAEAVRARLAAQPDLATWVCWEWLTDDGRDRIEIALSAPDQRPQPLAPPAQSTAGAPDGPGGGGRRLWPAIGALVLVIAVAFVACS